MLSIIIPVLNEAANLPLTLQSLVVSSQVELIVVDGGSQDNTVTCAKALGAKVIETLPGRAMQMNVGAQAAQGDILLFLHGDTRLPQGFEQLIMLTLSQPGVVAGAFELNIAGSLPGLRWVEKGVRWRSRYCQMPYGDQAIFLRATTFQAVNGFPDLPLMEDFELIRRLKKQGRIAIAPAAVITSARRWQTLGLWRTTAMHQLIILAYFLGISPSRIAQCYRRYSASLKLQQSSKANKS